MLTQAILYQNRRFHMLSPVAVRRETVGPFDRITLTLPNDDYAQLKMAPCGPSSITSYDAGISRPKTERFHSAGISAIRITDNGNQEVSILAEGGLS